MSKFWLDTEFHEYHKQPKVGSIKIGKPIPTVDLISIGIVSEDISSNMEYTITENGDRTPLHKNNTQKEYYAICKEFNIKDAWYSNEGTKEKPNYWIRENVLLPIIQDLASCEDGFDFQTTKRLINEYGKTKKQIVEDIKDFCIVYDKGKNVKELNPKFYVYYGAYDWVVFSQMFGGKMNMPKSFPYMFMDLAYEGMNKRKLVKGKLNEHKDYPKQDNAHNALDDAKWNKKLYNFLKTL